MGYQDNYHLSDYGRDQIRNDIERAYQGGKTAGILEGKAKGKQEAQKLDRVLSGPKLCVDCAQFIPAKTCTAKWSLVTGAKAYRDAETMRDTGDCGPDGLLFEAKISTVTTDGKEKGGELHHGKNEKEGREEMLGNPKAAQ